MIKVEKTAKTLDEGIKNDDELKKTMRGFILLMVEKK